MTGAKTRVLLSLVLLSLTAGGLHAMWPADASAWCRMTTSQRRPTVSMPCVLPDPDADPPEHFLEWRRPCSAMTLSMIATSRDLSDQEVLSALERSVASWEAVDCDGSPLGIDIEVWSERSTCEMPFYRDNGANVNTLMFVGEWGDRMYDPAAFAVTTVWHRKSTGEILDVDMEVNEQRGPYGVCPTDGCTDARTVDLENVFTHEMGHYLGLAHSTELEATMFASAVAGETLKRDLHADDIEGICAVYPPGTPEGECDHTPRGGLRLDCEEDGCAVATPGRSSSSPRAALGLLVMLALWRARRR